MGPRKPEPRRLTGGAPLVRGQSEPRRLTDCPDAFVILPDTPVLKRIGMRRFNRCDVWVIPSVAPVESVAPAGLAVARQKLVPPPYLQSGSTSRPSAEDCPIPVMVSTFRRCDGGGELMPPCP